MGSLGWVGWSREWVEWWRESRDIFICYMGGKVVVWRVLEACCRWRRIACMVGRGIEVGCLRGQGMGRGGG